MEDQIIDLEDIEFYKSILAVVSTIYRPIILDELVTFVDISDRVASNYKALSEIIGLYSSFLTLRGYTISFVYQSAKDFLVDKVSEDIYLSTIENIYSSIFSRSLQAISYILRCNIYSLYAPGISIDQVDNLLEYDRKGIIYNNLRDSGLVHKFLYQSFLYWFEVLSIIKSLLYSIADKSPNLYIFVYDTKRFALYSRLVIKQIPLQVYCSALVFVPEKSINAILQTLEGYTGSVNSVAFSPDGKQVVSGSRDRTVRLWDIVTDKPILPLLKGYIGGVNSLVSGSDDQIVQLWDIATGKPILPLLEGHTNSISSVAFSFDRNYMISESDNQMLLYNLAVSNDWIREDSINIL
ncbi:Vegetative incompatibility HET-E-1 protein [Rutstroemia sp. NJR-2017a BVV2]|nr:Vegetative incompatibility HET-E-1 protein [Rutstroemia sp. NJR-2017a BVV2]